MFKDGKAYSISLESLHKLLDMGEENVLYICDSLKPVARLNAFRLLITSPKKDNWSQFVQSPGVAEVVLPVFTQQEMMALREVAFSEQEECSEAEVRKRFELWGGSARSVLTHSDQDAAQDRLTTVANTLPLRTVEEAMTGTNALDGVGQGDCVHRMLELVPRGLATPELGLLTSDVRFYGFHHARLITDHVVGLFADSLLGKESDQLYRFLHKASADPAAKTLQGKLYERCIVVPRFIHGPAAGASGDMPLKRLSPTLSVPQPRWLQAPALTFNESLPLVYFNSPDQLGVLWAANNDNAIFVPRSKEFPVVDFVLRLDGQALLANATVGESHDVKLDNLAFWNKLLPAVGLGDVGTEIPLAWVLDAPAHRRFDDAGQVKSQTGADLESSVSARHPIGRRLAQYKLLLVVPPTTPRA